MVEKRFYSIIASFGAIFIYLFFVYALVDFVKNSEKIVQNFGYDVDDAVVVELVAPENKKPVEKKIEKPKPAPKPTPPEPEVKPMVKPIVLPPDPEPIVEPAKPTPEVEKVPEVEKESRDIVAKSAKDLFSTVRTDKYDKVMDERRKQDASRASRLKKQKAQERKRAQQQKQKALAEARAAMRSLESASAASHKKSGMEDAFWSPVSNRIQALWERTIQTQHGLNADVKITIDNQGRLRYRVKRLSNNSLFDKKLQIFLQNLEYESFPKYKGGASTSRIIEFEDKESF